MKSGTHANFHLRSPLLVGHVCESLVEHGPGRSAVVGMQTLVFEDSDCQYLQGYGDDGLLVGYTLMPRAIAHGVLPLPSGTRGPSVGAPAQFAVMQLVDGKPKIAIGDCSAIADLIGSPAFLATWLELAKHPRERNDVARFVNEEAPIFARHNPQLFGREPGTTFSLGDLSN